MGDADIAMLVAQGRFDALADRMRRWGGGRGTDERLEDAILDVLASGRLQGLRRALAARAEDGPGSLLLDLLVADAGVRVQAIDAGEVQRLFRRVTDAADPDLHLWVSAIAAEHHVWQGDLTGITVAQVALSAGAGPSRPLGFAAHGRLRRILAIAASIAAPEMAVEADAMVNDVAKELEASGQIDEAAVTVAFASFVRIVTYGHLADAELPRLHEAQTTLERIESDRATLTLVGAMWSSLSAWDFDEVDRCLLGLGGLDVDEVGPVVIEMVELGRLAADIARQGATPALVETTRQLFGRLRQRFVVIPTAALFIAVLLLDDGEWVATQDLLGTATVSSMMVSPTSEMGLREVTARLAVLRDRTAASVEELEHAMHRWIDAGAPRSAASSFLRASVDCDRVGLTEVAARLHRRGLELAPPPGERTVWEQVLVDRADVSAAPQRDGELLVMGADLVVRRGAESVPIPGVLARLLVLLVVRRRPVDTDWMIESLWPDIDPTTGRERLKANLWRLRKLLDVDRHELVARTRRGLELEPGPRWRIDLWEFGDLADGSTAQQIEAFQRFGVELCDRQFRYDEHVEWARLDLRRRWSALGQRLLGSSSLTAVEVAERILEVGVDDPVSVGRIRDAVAAAGDHPDLVDALDSQLAHGSAVDR